MAILHHQNNVEYFKCLIKDISDRKRHCAPLNINYDDILGKWYEKLHLWFLETNQKRGLMCLRTQPSFRNTPSDILLYDKDKSL